MSKTCEKLTARQVALADGRYLIYYTVDLRDSAPSQGDLPRKVKQQLKPGEET